jgi:hypothetical protein
LEAPKSLIAEGVPHCSARTLAISPCALVFNFATFALEVKGSSGGRTHPTTIKVMRANKITVQRVNVVLSA